MGPIVPQHLIRNAKPGGWDLSLPRGQTDTCLLAGVGVISTSLTQGLRARALP
jgi:hypothetical protein